MAGGAVYAATADEALKGCDGYPDALAPALCEAYLADIMILIESDDRLINPEGRLCLDEALTPADVIPIVVDWIKDHPGQRAISVFEATHRALAPQYRC